MKIGIVIEIKTKIILHIVHELQSYISLSLLSNFFSPTSFNSFVSDVQEKVYVTEQLVFGHI